MTWEGKVTLRASSAPPDATPVWVDITAFVHPGRRGTGWAMALGRQSTLAVAEPARLTLTLDNADHRFTPDNPSSPYYPWWTQGCRLQLQEQIGSWASDYPDFFLELPEVIVRTPGVDQTVTLTAVDRLGRLRSARTFVSTLAEHILYNGGTSLKAYWPMNDANFPFSSVVGGAWAAQPAQNFINYGQATATDNGLVDCVPTSADGPPGEDARLAHYDFEISTIAGLLRPARHMRTTAAIPIGALPLAAGQVLTAVAWIRSDWTALDTESIPLSLAPTDGSAVGFLTLSKQAGVNGAWFLDAASPGTLVGDVTGPIAPHGRWTQVGIRFGFSSSVLELWVDGAVTTGTLAGTPPSALSIYRALMPHSRFAGDIGHVQIYVGAASDWDFTDFTAQRAAALVGLEGQHTGDRVRTIAGYAGVSAGEVDADKGVAVMSPARLAGKDPLTALLEAETTEQGRLYCTGATVSFRHRHMRYDDRHTD